MNRYALSIATLVVSLSLAGCSWQKTNSLEDTIDSIQNNEMTLNCSDAINKGKNNVDGIGYLCDVRIDSNTVLKDEQGATLQLKDFSNGNEVRVRPVKPINLKKNRAFTAKEVVLLSREAVSSVDEIISALEKQGLTVTKREGETLELIRGIKPQVYAVNGEELVIYQFASEEEQQKGWAEFQMEDGMRYKNYNMDSFLLLFMYGKDLNTKIPAKIQDAVKELLEY
ncbi:hypothetical protein [Paenibacillus glycanilyticus]|uniref:Lipoprotein n=1 Tax=Paenibacillus glycanilyticus TaxID=126569 RepID=A0ABQ6G7C1_9BACL|nr:hypothetical protein [Paenibacillus glycanilyticus]GLX66143.1 hypothetical protein MU1_04870 [Paenibacillus glycanilyticus]